MGEVHWPQWDLRDEMLALCGQPAPSSPSLPWSQYNEEHLSGPSSAQRLEARLLPPLSGKDTDACSRFSDSQSCSSRSGGERAWLVILLLPQGGYERASLPTVSLWSVREHPPCDKAPPLLLVSLLASYARIFGSFCAYVLVD